MMEQQEMTREEAVKAITSYGNDAYTARGLEPGAKYWAVAVGIDADGHTTTKPTAEAFTAQTAPESTNTFEIATTAITQTGASIPLHRRTAMFTSWMFCLLTSSPRCRRVRIIKNI